ncbi:MAG: hypothetical protein KAR06_12160, partial [Deltaproteobacteria bacterium]|nr:hypothetical protein [Deltaproteobacteria bacterium]
VPVIIITSHFRIEGNLHMPHQGRVSDYLNKTVGGQSRDKFLSITNASCYPIAGGDEQYSAEFLTIHKDHMQIIIPR